MSMRESLPNYRWLRTLLKVTISVTIVAVGGVTFYVFGQKPEIETKDETQFDGALVETVEVGIHDEPLTVAVDGEATTYRIVEVGAEVAGRIEFKADESRGGHFVNAGDLLFKIDDDSYQLEVEQQQALLAQIDEDLRALNIDLDNISSLLTLAEEDLTLQRTRFERTRRLFERNATTESEFDNVKRDELAARNALQRLKNELSAKQQQKSVNEVRRKVTEVALKRAQLNLDRCTIIAPIDGRVVEDLIEQGNFVAAGQSLTRISDASRMEVRCQLQAEEVAWVWKQQLEKLQSASASIDPDDPISLIPVPCEVVYEYGGMETVWDAKLVRFDGTGLSRQTRTFPARVIVEHPEETRSVRTSAGAISITPPTLLSGLFVTVRIPIDLEQPYLSVPIEAVRPGGKLWLKESGRLKIVEVSVAKSTKDLALLKPNPEVSPGQRVIISPLAAVENGMLVREQTDEPEIAALTAAEGRAEQSLNRDAGENVQ